METNTSGENITGVIILTEKKLNRTTNVIARLGWLERRAGVDSKISARRSKLVSQRMQVLAHTSGVTKPDVVA